MLVTRSLWSAMIYPIGGGQALIRCEAQVPREFSCGKVFPGFLAVSLYLDVMLDVFFQC